MRRAVYVFAALAAFMLLTVAAQAASKGEQLFNQKCAMCHVVKGKGGAIGPELTAVASRLKEGELKGQLENPKKKNATSSMPSFKTLSKPDMDALLGYLKTLK
jgi:mono/diheme cytochrome c family protein